MTSQPARSDRYAFPARFLHWIIAILIIAQLALGWIAQAESDRADAFALIRTHYQFGMTIFALVLLRLSWRVTRGVPPNVKPAPVGWRIAAAIVHASLYILLLALPISGYVLWVWMDVSMEVFGLLDVPRLFAPPSGDYRSETLAWNVHYYGSWLLCALLAAHILAALWHEFILRDRLVLRRMF